MLKSFFLHSACQLGRKSWTNRNARMKVFLCRLFLFLLVPEFRLYKRQLLSLSPFVVHHSFPPLPFYLLIYPPNPVGPCARVCDMGSDVSFWTQLTPYTLNLFVSFFPFANGKWRCAGSRQQQANTRGNTRSLLTWQRYKPAAFGRKKQKGKKNSPSCCRRVSCVIHFRLGR